MEKKRRELGQLIFSILRLISTLLLVTVRQVLNDGL